MEGVAGTSASRNDFLNTPKETNEVKMTNKEIREDYFRRLRAWLTIINSYQLYYNKLQQDLIKNNYQQVTNNPTEIPRDIPNAVPKAQSSEPIQFVGIRCQIPSLWKRFGAELFDFMIVCIIQHVIIEYYAIDSIIDLKNISNITKYSSIFQQDDLNKAYTTAVQVMPELLFLVITHRIIACVYEIYWLQRSFSVQGAVTVGKVLMKIKVVRADKLFQIRGQPNDVIALTPGGGLGWKRGALRSVYKNICFAFFFPLTFVTAIAHQNRCQYDILCRSIVVEHRSVQPLRCEQSELIPIEYY